FERLAVVSDGDGAGGAGGDEACALLAWTRAVADGDLEDVRAAVRNRRAWWIDGRAVVGKRDEIDGGGAGFFSDGNGDGSRRACGVNAVAGVFGNDGIGGAAGQLT